MAVEFLVYAEDSTAFNKFPIHTSWMGSFLMYVSAQINKVDPKKWDSVFVDELNKFSAKMVYDNKTGMDRLRFEDEQQATLFFLKFS